MDEKKEQKEDNGGCGCGTGCLIFILLNVLGIYWGYCIWTEHIIPYIKELFIGAQQSAESMSLAATAFVRSGCNVMDAATAVFPGTVATNSAAVVGISMSAEGGQPGEGTPIAIFSVLSYLILFSPFIWRLYDTLRSGFGGLPVRVLVLAAEGREIAFLVSHIAVPLLGIVAAFVVRPVLLALSHAVSNGHCPLWGVWLWNFMMGDFFLKHGMVALYFYFACMMPRYVFRFLLKGEAYAFGRSVGVYGGSNLSSCEGRLTQEDEPDAAVRGVLNSMAWGITAKGGAVEFILYKTPGQWISYYLREDGTGSRHYKSALRRFQVMLDDYGVKWTRKQFRFSDGHVDYRAEKADRVFVFSRSSDGSYMMLVYSPMLFDVARKEAIKRLNP